MEPWSQPQPRRRLIDWLNYCIPAGSISGVRLGIHWIFPFFLVLLPLQEGTKHTPEWGMAVGITLVVLFAIVLAHEFGHVRQGRREGIDSTSVTLSPLGGLAHLERDAAGLAEVRIAAAGPLVNLLFAVLLLPVLWLLHLKLGLSLANPFHWEIPVVGGGSANFVQMVAYCIYKANLLNMYFNLLPAYPLDGGRILRGLLHKRLGRLRSTMTAATLGLVFAGVFLVVAIVDQKFILGLIAVFVGWQCWSTRRQARALAERFGEEEQGFMGYDFSMGHTSLEGGGGADRRAATRERKREEKERLRQEKEEERDRQVDAGVDQLLEKISKSGIDSLTRRERAFLEKASRRKQ